MKILKTVLVALASGMLAACSNPVRTEADHQANLADYRSFAWQQPEYGEVRHPVLDSELLGKRLRIAATRYLEDQGYVYDEQNPDFLVTYHATGSERPALSGSTGDVRVAHYTYRRDGSLLVTPITARNGHIERTSVRGDLTPPRSREEAILILDIIDRESDTLVWRGWRSKRLAGKRLDTRTVRKTVEEILAEFPAAS